MKHVNNERFQKTLSIIAFLLIILILTIIAVTLPANGYEISIYDAFPWYFWFLLIVTIFLGQMILLIETFSNQPDKHKRLWILGFVVIILPIIILLLLPYFRGYPIYGRGDHLSHLGIIRNIIDSGNIGQQNFYPNLHILTSILVIICKCSLIDMANVLPRVFFFVFPISLYIFYRAIFRENKEIMFALILCSSFLLFGSAGNYLAHYNLIFFLVPLVLYLFLNSAIKRNIFGFSLLLIIFLVGFIEYHPLSSLLLIFVFLIFGLILYYYKKLYTNNLDAISNKISSKNVINWILISFVIFLAWYLSFSAILLFFKEIFLSIFYELGTSPYSTQLSMVGQYNILIFDMIKIGGFTYGKYLIIILISFFSIFYMIIRKYRRKEKKKISILYSFSVFCFLLFGTLTAGAFFSDFIVGWGRFIQWSIFFSFILISLVFSVLLSNTTWVHKSIKKSSKLFTSIIICIILISIIFLSIFTFFYSPNRLEPNLQVTNMELIGARWFFDYRNEQNEIETLGISLTRFSEAIYGHWKHTGNVRYNNDTTLPDHFAYNISDTLGTFFVDSRYIIITRYGKISYPGIYSNYPQYWRFDENDFDRLSDDITVIEIYSNGDVETYLII